MKITSKLKIEHDKLLEKIKYEILIELQDNLPNAKVAKQRIESFIALNDLYTYIDKYNPEKSAKAYTNENKEENISYNYFEDILNPRLAKYRDTKPILFEIKGIELLEQGWLNSHLFSAFGIFQLAQFWGSNQSYSFQKIRSLAHENKYVFFVTKNKNFEDIDYVYNHESDKTQTAIMTKDVSQAIGSKIYKFYRESEKDKFQLIDEYLVLPYYSINSKNNKWAYINIQRLSSILQTNKLEYKDMIVEDFIDDKKQLVNGERFYRDPKKRDQSIQRAKGKCENEYCRNKVPFLNSIGEVFLESHHITFLSENGVDTLDNLIALCPNCHREAHHGEHKNKLKQNFLQIIKQKYH